MKTQELQYHLPQELIAQHPAEIRSSSRLLVLDRSNNTLRDGQFDHLGRSLRPSDCLVLNNTRVLPARFYGRRLSGAQLEGLFISSPAPDQWLVLLKGVRKLKAGETFALLTKDPTAAIPATFLKKTDNGLCLIRVPGDQPAETVLEAIGFPPLPPYIKRDRDLALAAQDKQRYQTVYADHLGAIAAPTAGLHFTETLIHQLKDQGITFTYLTLHVGIGTFQPVTVEDLKDHPMHAEYIEIPENTADIVNAARAQGRRIVAVGTTSTRALETGAVETGTGWDLQSYKGETRLFITPGYRFKMTDALITNFHLPRSTLLALVGAFGGMEFIRKAYQHAIREQYRFYSYGDAMLIL